MRHSTIVILMFALALCACATAATEDAQLHDRDWTLVSVDGFASLPSGVATPTIRFGSDGQLSGNTGCNLASGSYTTSGDSLTVGPLISTRRACADERGNELERAYVRAAEATRRFRVANGELELVDEGGRTVAKFRG
jgi:heat shock protein HslJ